ncbi:DUF424 family protein [Candidatus Woesearchaeota archaeon]|nr:MAG: DUF424 family protein [Candidatus Woesearchaeota archaeon]
MIVAIHQTKEHIILAICDTVIYKKIFTEGKKQLDLASKFYSGTEKTKEEVKKLLRRAYIVNAVGQESVALLEEEELITKDNIASIADIPFTQVLLLDESTIKE